MRDESGTRVIAHRTMRMERECEERERTQSQATAISRVANDHYFAWQSQSPLTSWLACRRRRRYFPLWSLRLAKQFCFHTHTHTHTHTQVGHTNVNQWMGPVVGRSVVELRHWNSCNLVSTTFARVVYSHRSFTRICMCATSRCPTHLVQSFGSH